MKKLVLRPPPEGRKTHRTLTIQNKQNLKTLDHEEQEEPEPVRKHRTWNMQNAQNLNHLINKL